MVDPIEHERMRFKSMTQEQLLTRLGRITKIEKLENFISVARLYKYNFLVERAKEKLAQLENPGQKVISKPTAKIQKQVKTKTIEKIPDPKPLKRALSF